MRALLLALALPSLAYAHAVGLSQGHYRATADGLEAELTFTRAELDSVGGNDRWLAERILAPGCSLTSSSATPADRDGVTVHARWACESAPREVRLEFLADLPTGHRHLAEHQVLHAGARVLRLAKVGPGFGAVVMLGVEHIVTGWDHLLFLFGMVLMAARARAVLKVITAFTIAHSITLAAGVLGVLAPSPRWVEPLIALSIAWVGVENLVAKDLEKRWRVAFGFGLLHGFGFAGGLQDIGAGAELPVALLGFNLGVEVGQLAVLAVMLPLLALARRSPRVWLIARPALSAIVIVPGLIWFAVRLSGG